MNPGLREYRQSSLRVVIPDLPEDMRDGIREIASLESRDTGKGYATTLLWDVCREADEAHMVLMIQPHAFASALMDDKKLERFYSKFNFVKIQELPVVLMARQPEIKRYIQ